MVVGNRLITGRGILSMPYPLLIREGMPRATVNPLAVFGLGDDGGFSANRRLDNADAVERTGGAHLGCSFPDEVVILDFQLARNWIRDVRAACRIVRRDVIRGVDPLRPSAENGDVMTERREVATPVDIPLRTASRNPGRMTFRTMLSRSCHFGTLHVG